MEIAREDDIDEHDALPVGNDYVAHRNPSSHYTVQWLANVQFPPRADSLSREQDAVMTVQLEGEEKATQPKH